MKHSTTRPTHRPDPDANAMIRRHLLVGWHVLLCFLTFGLVLEAFHGVKLPFYLNVSNETRRLMWTLAHAHGTVLGLVNLAMAETMHHVSKVPDVKRQMASLCLLGATILIPCGFFLGGLFLQQDAPGLPAVLVPSGGLLLLVAVFQTARMSVKTATSR